MKKIIAVLALVFLVGCAFMSTKAPVPDIPDDVCAWVDENNTKDTTVVASLVEEQEYMYWLGAELSRSMDMYPDAGRWCVWSDLHMMHRNLTNKGQVCAEVRDDGLYICETSCDYVAGTVTKVRWNVCSKVVQ